MLSTDDFHVMRRHHIALGTSTLIAIGTMAVLTAEGHLANPPSPHQISQLALLAAAGAIIWAICLTSWCYRNASTFNDRALLAAWRNALTSKEDQLFERWQTQCVEDDTDPPLGRLSLMPAVIKDYFQVKYGGVDVYQAQQNKPHGEASRPRIDFRQEAADHQKRAAQEKAEDAWFATLSPAEQDLHLNWEEATREARLDPPRGDISLMPDEARARFGGELGSLYRYLDRKFGDAEAYLEMKYGNLENYVKRLQQLSDATGSNSTVDYAMWKAQRAEAEARQALKREL